MKNKYKTIIILVLILCLVVVSVIFVAPLIKKSAFKEMLSGGTIYWVETEGYSEEQKKKVVSCQNLETPKTIITGEKDIHSFYISNQAEVAKICTESADNMVYVKTSDENNEPVTVFETGIVKEDNYYYVETNNNKHSVLKVNLRTNKNGVIFETDKEISLLATQSERLYLKNGSQYLYFDNSEIKTVPENKIIGSLIAANDDSVAFYYNKKINLYNATDFDLISSTDVDEQPNHAVLSPNSDKLLYCMIDDKDYFAGNTDRFFIYKVVRLLDGKYVTYKDDRKIDGFVDWK